MTTPEIPTPAPTARRYDLWLICLTAAMVAWGLLMMYSASAFQAAETYKDPWHYVVRQGVAVVLGVGAMIVLAMTPYRRLREWAPGLWMASLVLLVMVHVPGISHSAKGATRWIELGPLHFQPAEFTKLATLIALGSWLHRNRGDVNNPRTFLVSVAIVVPQLLAIITQPDFGSTAIVAVLCGVMYALAGLRSWFMGALAGFGAVVLALVAVAEPYRIKRLVSFIDPFADCSGDGYQVCQSLLAMHQGGLVGRGMGESVAKMLFLPEPYNDFIAAVLGEELGLVGVLALVLCYLGLAIVGFRIARRAPDAFGATLASTFTVMIVGQACLNLGVVMSVVPPKGLVLPFMSYGATAMMMNLAAIGVLLSISAERVERPAAFKGMADFWLALQGRPPLRLPPGSVQATR